MSSALTQPRRQRGAVPAPCAGSGGSTHRRRCRARWRRSRHRCRWPRALSRKRARSSWRSARPARARRTRSGRCRAGSAGGASRRGGSRRRTSASARTRPARPAIVCHAARAVFTIIPQPSTLSSRIVGSWTEPAPTHLTLADGEQQRRRQRGEVEDAEDAEQREQLGMRPGRRRAAAGYSSDSTSSSRWMT